MYKRQLDIRPKHVVLALLTLVAIACGVIALVEFELRNTRLDFDLSGLATVVSVGTLRPPPCSSAVNRPLAGDPTQEATMAYVAGVVDLYRTTFSKMPESITDLDELPTFENADKLNADEMKRTCFIEQMRPNRGYVLACGGKLPPMERLDFALARIVDERFVIVDGMEVLYIPFSGGCI